MQWQVCPWHWPRLQRGPTLLLPMALRVDVPCPSGHTLIHSQFCQRRLYFYYYHYTSSQALRAYTRHQSPTSLHQAPFSLFRKRPQWHDQVVYTSLAYLQKQLWEHLLSWAFQIAAWRLTLVVQQ